MKLHIIVPSIGVAVPVLLLAWLYTVPRPESPPPWSENLDAVNAALNTLCTIFLVTGWIFIKRRKEKAHIRCMVSAVLSSFVFLITYLTYHHFHGDTRFLGQGWIRPVYFFVLITHIIASMVNFPMILITLSHAISGNRDKHRWWARRTLPLWIYVSVTGVMIYLMLKAFG